MKNTFILIYIFINIGNIFCQPVLQWDKTFYGPSAADKGKDIAVDASGNVYVTGSSDGFGTGSDFLTIKYNSSGDTLWTKRYNGIGNGADVPVEIKVDIDGNVYVTGNSQGNGTGYNIVTIKYNFSGTQQWVAIYNGVGNQDDKVFGLAVDASGNVYVCGSSFFSVGATFHNGVVVKYDNMGVQQWVDQLDLINNDVANLIKINNNGKIVVTLYAERTPPQNGGYIVGEDGFRISEINPNGTLAFFYDASNYPFTGYPNAMALDGNSDIYVTSSFPSTGSVGLRIFKFVHLFSGAPAQPPATLNPAGINGVDIKIDANYNIYVLADNMSSSHDFLTFKYNSSLTKLWSNSYLSGNSPDYFPVSLAVNNNTNPDVYVSGYTTKPNGTNNFVSVKYNSIGDTLWTQEYDCGNNSDDVATKMVIDNNCKIYITGYSKCNGPNEDFKTVKYCDCAPPKPGPIMGSAILCNSSPQTYSVVPVAGAISYTWTLPVGWTGTSTTNSITSNVGSSGNITVKANGVICSSAEQILAVSVNNSVAVITPNGNTTFCAGGSVLLTATPGSSYMWSNGSSAASINVTTSGNYTVTVTFANGCTAVSLPKQVIVNPLPQTPTIAPLNPTICPGMSVVLTSSKADSNLWNTGSMNQSIIVSTAGAYSVTVSNGFGCTAVSMPSTVNFYPPIPADITADGPTSFCVGGSVNLTASNGSSYAWSTGAATQSIHVTNAGNYTVTITSVFGCTNVSAPTTVTVNSSPTATISPAGIVKICQGSSVVLTASSGSSYLWSTGSMNQSINVSLAGNYTVTVTISPGCTAVSPPTMVMINPLPTPPTISTLGSLPICLGDSVKLMSSSSSGNLWNTGSTSQSIFVKNAGNYSVTVTDINGCKASVLNPVNVAIYPVFTLTFNSANESSPGASNGSATVNVAGGLGPFSYKWNNAGNSTTQTITGLSAGTYDVTVTDTGSGCMVKGSVVIVVNGNVNYTISGNISVPSTLQNAGLVMVNMTGSMTTSFTTTNNGNYSFVVPSTSNITIKPSKNINPGNGISVLDLSIILQHVTNPNKPKLNTPYLLIAANCNNDTLVTATDVAIAQAIILGNIKSFPNNTSWVFVPKSYVFPNPLKPWKPAYNNSISYSNLSGDQTSQDYWAIKVGDVSYNANPTLLTGENELREYVNEIKFVSKDKVLSEGEIINVDFTTENFEEILGYQFTMEADKNYLEILEPSFGKLPGLNKDYFGLNRKDEGLLTSVWFTSEGYNLNSRDKAFGLSFKVKKGGKRLSDCLKFSDSQIFTSAFNSDYKPVEIGLKFTNDLVSNETPGFELYQNQPNPFKNTTTISFNLPNAQKAKIQILDVDGRIVKAIEKNFEKGFNKEEISLNNVSPGIYYYKVSTSLDSGVKKMIVLE